MKKRSQGALGCAITWIVVFFLAFASVLIINTYPHIFSQGTHGQSTTSMVEHTPIPTQKPSSTAEQSRPIDEEKISKVFSPTTEEKVTLFDIPFERDDTPDYSFVSLPQLSTDGTIGQGGVAPGTPIAIVKNKTDSKIFYDTCTVSFSLMGAKGLPWAITAGHCGSPGDKVYPAPADGKIDIDNPIGTVRKISTSSYDKNTKTGSGDWGVISLDPRAKLPDYTGLVPMKLSLQKPKLNSYLCKHGSTTGYNCGKKTREDIIANFTPKDDSTKSMSGKQDEVQLCALPGDSGSPIFDDQGIIGVISATHADVDPKSKDKCLGVPYAYYVPIDEVISEIEQNTKDIVIEKEL